jgi:homoserine acetyltransferase
MWRTTVAALAACILAAITTGSALAHGPNQPPHQRYAMGDLTLESGEIVMDFAISYVTHGTLNAKKSNAILMVTALTGNHHRLDFLIGPGKALDTNKYFVVCTDAIGNGLTSSPSNSAAQPRMKFPRFTIRDMVRSQQSWAYDAHDVGTTPGMNGDYVRALRAIEAKTFVMIGTKDLLNPEWEPQEAARYIRDARVTVIRPDSVTGHYAAGGFLPADVEVMNAEIGQFLDVVTQRGERLR